MTSRLATRRTALVAALAVLAVLAVPIVAMVVASGEGVPFAPGDVFVSVGNGKIKHFDSAGKLVDTLDGNQSGEGGGIVFDAAGRLYGANFTANAVTQFNPTGSLLGTFGSGYDAHPEGMVRDHAGDIYVGLNDGSRSLLKFDADGNLVDRFTPDVENRGIDWADLDDDQCTLLYTSEGRTIKRFDVCANEQRDDFATLPIGGDNRTDPTSSAYAVRIRQNGEVMVATAGAVYRLDPSGQVLQTYTLPRTGQLLTLDLDADLTSFWTGDHATGQVFKVDIASGQVLQTLDAAPEPDALVGGVAIAGELLRAEPRLQLSTAGGVVVGQDATLTASLLNVVDPADRDVTFTVRGANPQVATVKTDASGNAVFRYRAANAGTDTVTAEGSSGRPLASLQSNAVSLSAAPAPATSLVYAGASSGVVGQPATLAARLTDASTNQPLPGATLHLGLRNGEQCDATTDDDGLGACRVVAQEPPGSYTATADFGGSPVAAPSSTTAPFTLTQQVERIDAALAYTGPASGLQGEPVTLSARLVESPTGRPIAGSPVTFAVNQTDTCGANTDGDGVATCQTRLTQAPGNQPVTVRAEGDGLHKPASTSAQLLVRSPTGPVQGGRAVVLALNNDALGARGIADTGEVASDGTTSVPVSAVALPGPVLAGTLASANVTTKPGSADVEASLASLNVDLLPPLTSGLSITLRGVMASAHSSCANGSTGDVRLGFLTIGPVVLVANEVAVPPNTVLAVPDLPLLPHIAVTLNEQKATDTRSRTGITVNAVHIVIAGVADIVVSSARSDVHGCTAS